MSDTAPAGSGITRRARWTMAGFLALLYVAIVLPVLWSGRIGTGESADQVNYHVPVIRTMAAQWPRVDLKQYDSATTPGYHLLMAWVWRQTDGFEKWQASPKMPQGAGPEERFPAVTLTELERSDWNAFVHALRPLQLVNAILSLGLILCVYFTAARFVSPLVAAAMTLPLSLNQYVVGASIWLTTDNTAWLFAVLALSAAGMHTTAFSAGRALRAGLWATIAVFVRQIHLWVVAPIAAAGAAASGLLPGLVTEPGSSGRRVGAPTILACLLPVLVVGGFAALWGGLVPVSDRIREVHGHGMNPAAAPFALSLTGAYGLFFVGAWWGQIRRLSPRDPLVWLVVGTGLLAAVAVATSTQQPTLTDPPQRGYGWLWRVSGAFPTVRDRSLLFVAAAPCGALVVLMLMRAARDAGRGRAALVLGLGLLGWLAAQIANPAAWQRYFDPIVLIGLAWMSALAVRDRPARGLWIGPILLALMLGAITARTMQRDLSRNEMPFDGGVLKMRGELK